MIRTNPTTGLIEQKPRKLLKLDLIHQKQYNEFQGNSQIDEKVPQKQSDSNHGSHKNKLKQQNHLDIQNQIYSNQNIFQLISHSHLKFRKVNDLIQSNNPKNTPSQLQSSSKLIKPQIKSLPFVKFQEGTESPTVKTEDSKQKKIQNKMQDKKKNNQKIKPSEPSSNWKKFLQSNKTPNKSVEKIHKTTSQSNYQKNGKIPTINESSKFVAIDCEFVKCGQSDELARISIVSQNSQTLYDSYIKPDTKVTDFLTQITGITYSHIKQAPKWSEEMHKVKKILMGKIIVGHTLEKDLEVTKLSNWKGISQKINIANFSQYREKGGSKVVSLKRMALSFLNRNIQSGWHSSVEDAVATIDLFKLNKKKILKEFKLI